MEHLRYRTYPSFSLDGVAIAVGTYVGLLLFKRTPDYLLKRIVYMFVGASGLWIALQQFFLAS
ncbi:hypothetical protein [uncultured Sphaerochaeta sp.]|uniref:hypothetical protein n=1 Tax=uncultured Sphaerochaeta sp. TaxID=886478 RepID=UPI002AA6331E|nr:hypothetical protein [uncultured Sphaerochaeta sp.]